MTTQEIAQKLVQHCREGKNLDAVQDFYADDVISYEMPGNPLGDIKGKAGVLDKNQQWFDAVEEIHSVEISEPQVIGNFFSVAMKYDVTYKKHGRVPMDELAVYEVKDGKIVADRFFYHE